MLSPLNFRISSALKSVIGRDLITNDFVAIFELVKNSFDAGANKIDLVFHSGKDGMKKIFVIDNGKGMSYHDLVNKWLFVAYSAKQDGSEDLASKKNRIYAGNKGVGRFSCDRLGGHLKLQSLTESSDKVNILNVNWGDFEQDSKQLFSDIDITHSVVNKLDLPSEVLILTKGVVLEISVLRDPASWNRSKLLKLRRHLEKLVNPFGDARSKININLHCISELAQDQKEKFKSNSVDNYLEAVNGIIKNKIFDTLKDKTTWLQVDMDEQGDLISSLVDRGELIYKIKESSGEYPELIDTNFSCQIFYLNLSAKQTFKRRQSIHSVEFGSLFLFRNGFRVFPIGEAGNDYWKVDRRRQQGYARYLGTRDLMGRINIAGPEYKFKESSSRDKGLIETDAAKQLFDCVTHKCIRRLESYVVGVTWKDKLDKQYDTIQRLGIDENRSRIIELVGQLAKSNDIELLDYSHDLINILSEKSNYFESSLERLAELAKGMSDSALQVNIDSARKKFAALKEAEKEALRIADEEAAARRAAEQHAENEKQQRIEAEEKAGVAKHAYEEEKKRNLFLVSSESRDKEQLESFLHQIVIYTSTSKQKITAVISQLKDPKFDFNRESISVSLSELLETTEKIMTTSRFATTANFKLDSTEIEDDVCLYVEQYIEKICTAYNSRINIQVEKSAKPFIFRFKPIELGMILDNMVSNAKKARASQIIFKIKDISSGVLEISITDNGRGLSSGVIEPYRIFEKGFTTTRGSGLGLYHSKKQVENMGGELVLPDLQPNKGLQLIMRLRKK
ncbi:MAG: sensor histidine kinase [Endozoicomonadaceae bacterium]|nr:sensor histidine kinase [Endozoicomonadaceae bacterium]